MPRPLHDNPLDIILVFFASDPNLQYAPIDEWLMGKLVASESS